MHRSPRIIFVSLAILLGLLAGCGEATHLATAQVQVMSEATGAPSLPAVKAQVESEVVRSLTRERLGLGAAEPILPVIAEAQRASRVISLRVRGQDRDLAVRTANAYAEVLVLWLNQRASGITEGMREAALVGLRQRLEAQEQQASQLAAELEQAQASEAEPAQLRALQDKLAVNQSLAQAMRLKLEEQQERFEAIAPVARVIDHAN